jgi:hypothetical protein
MVRGVSSELAVTDLVDQLTKYANVNQAMMLPNGDA